MARQRIHAIYEDGVLRPLSPLEGVAEHARVSLLLETTDQGPRPPRDWIGILPDAEAEAMKRAIEEEFETIEGVEETGCCTAGSLRDAGGASRR